jgi:hypothetical protein
VPTLAALAGVALPSDRVYDGVDLGPLLRGAVPDEAGGHTTLFHPIGDGSYPHGLPAMRLGKYKAHFRTHAAVPCHYENGTHRGNVTKTRTVDHDPPLIFDLSVDRAEARPVDPASIPGVLQRVKAEYEAYWRSVNTTMRSRTDYGSGGRKFAPCGNASSPSCRTRLH